VLPEKRVTWVKPGCAKDRSLRWKGGVRNEEPKKTFCSGLGFHLHAGKPLDQPAEDQRVTNRARYRREEDAREVRRR